MTPIRIIIADDIMYHRVAIRGMLQEATDIQIVGEATNGQEAVDLTFNLEPDIILMDMSMPEIKGFEGVEATQTIYNSGSKTRILALSEHNRDEFIFPVIQAGARGYLLKESTNIIEAIRAVMNDSVIFSPTIAKRIQQELQNNNSFSDLPAEIREMNKLTQREKEILDVMIHEGLTNNQEIANHLNALHPDTIPVKAVTIASHITSILHKLNMADKSKLMWRAMKSSNTIIAPEQIAALIELACSDAKPMQRKPQRWTPLELLKEAIHKGYITEIMGAKINDILRRKWL